MYIWLCYRIVSTFKSEEFSLSYSELSENCTIAESTNNLEPIVYKYNSLKTTSIVDCVVLQFVEAVLGFVWPYLPLGLLFGCFISFMLIQAQISIILMLVLCVSVCLSVCLLRDHGNGTSYQRVNVAVAIRSCLVYVYKRV